MKLVMTTFNGVVWISKFNFIDYFLNNLCIEKLQQLIQTNENGFHPGFLIFGKTANQLGPIQVISTFISVAASMFMLSTKSDIPSKPTAFYECVIILFIFW